jgi:hypothetical protein
VLRVIPLVLCRRILRGELVPFRDTSITLRGRLHSVAGKWRGMQLLESGIDCLRSQSLERLWFLFGKNVVWISIWSFYLSCLAVWREKERYPALRIRPIFRVL